MKSVVMIALLFSMAAFAEEAKKATSKVVPPASGDCNKIAQASDTQETTIFECIRKVKGDNIYCLVVKSGFANGTPTVATSCVKL